MEEAADEQNAEEEQQKEEVESSAGRRTCTLLNFFAARDLEVDIGAVVRFEFLRPPFDFDFVLC